MFANGKWLPLKDKKFRFGRISFKLIVIKLTERQTSRTIGGRSRTIRWRERRQIGSKERTENHQWRCGKGHGAAQWETNNREGPASQPASQTHSCQGFPVRMHSKARVEKVKQQ